MTDAWQSIRIRQFEHVMASPATSLLRISGKPPWRRNAEQRPRLLIETDQGSFRFAALPAPADPRGLLRAAYSAPTELIGSDSRYALEHGDGSLTRLPQPQLGAGRASRDPIEAEVPDSGPTANRHQSPSAIRAPIESPNDGGHDERRSDLIGKLSEQSEALADSERSVAENDQAQRLAEAEIGRLRGQLSALEHQLAQAAAAADQRIAEASATAEQQVLDAQAAAEQQVLDAQANAKQRAADAQANAEQQVHDAQASAEQQAADAQANAEQRAADAQANAEQQAADAQANAEQRDAEARARLAEAQQRAAEAEDRAQSATAEAAAARETAEALEQRSGKLDRLLAEQQEKSKTLERQLADRTSPQEAVERELEALRSSQASLEHELDQSRDQLRIMTFERDELSRQANAFDSVAVKARERASHAELSNEQLNATLQELQTWRGELERRLTRTTSELGVAKTAREADERELKRLRAALDEASARPAQVDRGEGETPGGPIGESSETLAAQASEIELLAAELASLRAGRDATASAGSPDPETTTRLARLEAEREEIARRAEQLAAFARAIPGSDAGGGGENVELISRSAEQSAREQAERELRAAASDSPGGRRERA